jgi:putative ABC transport system ATP-binding protein
VAPWAARFARGSGHAGVGAPSHLPLQLPPRGPEGVADGDVDVRVCGISVGGPSGNQMRAWNAQIHLDAVEAAPLLVLVWDLDGDAAADQTRKDLLEVGHPASNVAFDSFARRNSMERDLERCLHDHGQCSSWANQPSESDRQAVARVVLLTSAMTIGGISRPGMNASVGAEGSRLISLEEVSKIYRLGDVSLRALDRVSLAIVQGEFVAVMGSSGSGKSTLMNIIGCLDRPTDGRYTLAGSDVSSLSKDQLFNLLPRTSALENVELPLVYAGIPAGERQDRAAAALRSVGLGDRVRHFPSELSGGQQQRVAIARAVVNHPRIILADEPTGNLDSRTSEETMALFQALGDQGITIVLVTHEADVAHFSSRVITLRDGRIASDRRQVAERARRATAALAV